MPNLIDLTPSSRFFGMFIARSSAGKSAACASFPKPIHYLDTDLRMRGVLACKEFIDLSDITYTSFQPGKGYEDIMNEILVLKIGIENKSSKIKTIIFDSTTGGCRRFLSEGVKLAQNIQIVGSKTHGLRLEGPAEYKYEKRCMLNIFDALQSIPCNIIFTSHIISRYGSDPGDKFAPSTIIGEELAIRPNIGEVLLSCFDEVYRFERTPDGDKYSVRFNSDMARSAYKMPKDSVDITNKRFYDVWLNLVNGSKSP